MMMMQCVGHVRLGFIVSRCKNYTVIVCRVQPSNWLLTSSGVILRCIAHKVVQLLFLVPVLDIVMQGSGKLRVGIPCRTVFNLNYNDTTC